jgi:hypothetical protein
MVWIIYLQSSSYSCDVVRVSLCPLPQYDPLNLSAWTLGYLVDELDSTGKSLVLCDLCCYPLDHILLADFAFGCFFQHHICSGQVFVVFIQSAHSSISNIVIFE